MRAWAMAMVGGVMLGAVPAWAASGKAALTGTAEGSTVSGLAALRDTDEGLQVDLRVSGVPAGTHGLHIHEAGDCGDGGTAAGGHFNPDKAPHGFLPKDGAAKAHPGDMGNIDVGQDGTGSLSLTLPGAHLASGPYAVAGRAIILHEKADDFGQPTGNAGGRIGCGAIVLTK